MELSRRKLLGASLLLPFAGCVPAPGASVNEPGDVAQLILADPAELGSFNPVDGYGELGVSPLYDGLLRPVATDDQQIPTLEPALAAAAPESNDDQSEWTIAVRDDISFHDGSRLTAEDVAATYRAVINPDSGSSVAAAYAMIDSVEVDGQLVRFRLDGPYADFPVRMLLGIAPAGMVAGVAADSALNTAPVGTGPFRLAELRPDQVRFEANPDYFGGAPALQEVIVLHVPDDNIRAQRMAAGEFDGTVMPPRLARAIPDAGELVAVRSADWRGVSLPRTAFTEDPRVRVALNLATNRQLIIDEILAGHGRLASTPVPADVFDDLGTGPAFAYEPATAESLLAEAGWEPGTDGIRTRDGERAALTIMYAASDTVRRDCSMAWAADMQRIGVEVTLEGLSWDEIEPRLAQDATLLAGGSQPYSLDSMAYTTLHSLDSTSGSFDNPGGFSSPALDEALEQARRASDPADVARHYRTALEAYMENPGYVFLTFLDHVYLQRPRPDWSAPAPILEPHSHGVGWGPWWDLAAWRPQ